MIADLDAFKLFMDIDETDDSKNDLLNIYLTAVDSLFGYLCDREFDSTEYTNELYDGDGSQFLSVRNYPISVAPIVWAGRTDAINIRNTDTSATYAQALVDRDNEKVTLIIAGGSNPGADDVDYETYPTLSDIVTQISTLGKGWVASIYNSNLSSILSSQLLPVSVMCGSQQNNAASDETLKIPDDVISIERFEPATGRLFRPSGFSPGFQNYAASYTGGYTAAAMPSGLHSGVLVGAQALYNRGQEDGFRADSFSAGSLQINYGDWLPDLTLQMIDFYARDVIV